MGKVVFNEERLLPIFEDFYRVFGIHISIFEPPFNAASFDEKFYYMNSVAYPFPGPSGICLPLRRSRRIDDRCILCDEEAVRHLMQTKKPYIYKCHLGLLEAMVPALYEDSVVAIVIIGGVSGTVPDDAYADHFVANLMAADREYYAPIADSLRSLIRSVKVIDETTLKSICRLIEAFLRTAFMDGTIIMHKGSVSTELISYVMLNIDKPITLAKACEQIGVTRSYLCHAVREKFGMTFSEYVHQEKIARAKRLLLSTPLSVNDIAEQLGYGSPAYFTRVFKKLTGVLPSRYRETERKAI